MSFDVLSVITWFNLYQDKQSINNSVDPFPLSPIWQISKYDVESLGNRFMAVYVYAYAKANTYNL